MLWGLCVLAVACVASGVRETELGTVKSLSELGVPRTWAAAILAGDHWAANAGEAFRVIDETGEEQVFNGKVYRTLEDLTSAGSEIDFKYLVVPNKVSSKAIASLQSSGAIEFVGPVEGTKLETLQRDAAKSYGNHFLYLMGVTTISLQRAYMLGHEDGKLAIGDGAPLAQAKISMQNHVNVLFIVQTLFENNAKVQDVAKSNNYAAIAHIAAVLAHSGQNEHELHNKLEPWWCVGATAADISGDCILGVAKAYSDLDGDFRVKHHLMLKKHHAIIRAVVAAAGTSGAKLRDAGDGLEQILEEKKLPLETKAVQSLASLGENAQAVLQAATWPEVVESSFRVMNDQGEEQVFHGKRFRTLDEILGAGHLVDGKYLVVSNRASRKELSRSKNVTLTGWLSIDILEKDCGKEKASKRLARAYRIAHDFYDPSKFTLEDGAPVSQARLVIAEAGLEPVV